MGLAAEVHVLDDVEVVAEREILVDDLDPELGRVLRPVDVDSLAVEDTSPLSGEWMPATHLIRVDLPAPLSPTRAITSPGRTSKSTSVSACTEPKLFEIPWSSSSGVVDAGAVVMCGKGRWGRHEDGPTRSRFLGAVLLEFADADLRLLQVAVEELLVVRLRDRHGLDDVRRQRPAPFFTVPVCAGVWPFESAIAASADAVASFRVSFQTVIVCQPEMMFWTPCSVAS